MPSRPLHLDASGAGSLDTGLVGRAEGPGPGGRLSACPMGGQLRQNSTKGWLSAQPPTPASPVDLQEGKEEEADSWSHPFRCPPSGARP